MAPFAGVSLFSSLRADFLRKPSSGFVSLALLHRLALFSFCFLCSFSLPSDVLSYHRLPAAMVLSFALPLTALLPVFSFFPSFMSFPITPLLLFCRLTVATIYPGFTKTPSSPLFFFPSPSFFSLLLNSALSLVVSCAVRFFFPVTRFPASWLLFFWRWTFFF